MNEFKQKNNTAYLHKNKYKKEDKHPSYRGKALIDGNEKDTSLWYNKEKDYFFISIQEPYKKENNDLSDGDIKSDNQTNDLPF